MNLTKLREIERRILEIDTLLSDRDREKKIGGPVALEIFKKRVEKANRPLTEERAQLETERQFILDRRDSLFWRFIWNIVVPIIISVITVFMLKLLGLT